MKEKTKKNKTYHLVCIENARFYINGRWYLSGDELNIKENELTEEIKKQTRRIKR